MIDANRALPKEISCPNCGAELELEEKERMEMKFICPKCNTVVDIKSILDSKASAQINALEILTPEWAKHIEKKLADLESALQATKSRLPDSDIINPRFWTRAWTVFGHQLSITIVIYAVIFILVILIKLMH